MTTATPADWFYPLVVAQVMGAGRPEGTYQVPFANWMLWHYAFRLKGAGFRVEIVA